MTLGDQRELWEGLGWCLGLGEDPRPIPNTSATVLPPEIAKASHLATLTFASTLLLGQIQFIDRIFPRMQQRLDVELIQLKELTFRRERAA